MDDFEDDDFQPAPDEGGQAPGNLQVMEAAKQAYEWQQSRRRPDGSFGRPITGFGSTKMPVTLWLPNAEVHQRKVFRDQRLYRETVPSAMTTPNMLALRKSAIAAWGTPAGRAEFDLILAGYAAALIQLNYAVTDDDLTTLLEGTDWQDQIARHLLGGDDAADRLVQIDMETALNLLLPQSPPPRPDPVVRHSVEHRSMPARSDDGDRTKSSVGQANHGKGLFKWLMAKL